MSARISVPSCLLILCSASLGSAAIWTVRPDGTGDAPTIQTAIDSAAVQGDVIELADGVFTGPGNRDLINYEKWLVFRSQSGNPADCVIDLEGSPADPHGGFTFSGDG